MKRTFVFVQKKWLSLIICFLIAVGIFLKFYNINNRFFWYDEIYTIQHVKGNHKFIIAVNEIKNKNYYLDQLSLNKQNYSLKTQVKGLFSSPNLNSLHYLLLMFWYRIAGDNLTCYRLFSLLIFIGSLPFLFLLIKKISGSGFAGLIALCFYCASPYFNYFAQEARYYILWTFLVIVLHYLILNALSYNKIKWWIWYSIVGILSLYANILSSLIFVGHFIYILIFRNDIIIKYTIYAIIIFICYIPYLNILIINHSEISETLSWHSWAESNSNLIKLITAQFLLMAESFVSFKDSYGQLNFNAYLDIGNNYQLICNSTLIVILIIYSIIHVVRKMPREKSLFIFFLILPQFLFFIITDFIRNTAATYTHRYHVINIIGILILISYLIHEKIKSENLFYLSVFLILILLGLNSIYVNSKNRCWYTAPYCERIVEQRQLFITQSKTLILSDYSIYEKSKFIDFLSIVNEYKTFNVDYLIASPDIKNVNEMLIDKRYANVYVISASEELIDNLTLQFSKKMQLLSSGVWSINR